MRFRMILSAVIARPPALIPTHRVAVVDLPASAAVAVPLAAAPAAAHDNNVNKKSQHNAFCAETFYFLEVWF